MCLTLFKSLAGLTQHLVTDYKQVVELLEEGIAKRYFIKQTSSIFNTFFTMCWFHWCLFYWQCCQCFVVTGYQICWSCTWRTHKMLPILILSTARATSTREVVSSKLIPCWLIHKIQPSGIKKCMPGKRFAVNRLPFFSSTCSWHFRLYSFQLTC